MVKTRPKKSSAVTSKAKSQSNEQEILNAATKTLEATAECPPGVFMLPKDTATNARIVTIDSTDSSGKSTPHRYLIDPTVGFFEFANIAATKSACRSWLLAPDLTPALEVKSSGVSPLPQQDGINVQHHRQEQQGYVLSAPNLFIATPIDPLFILLSVDGILFPCDDGTGRPEYTDIATSMWNLKNNVPQLRQILEEEPESNLQKTLESRFRSVCRAIDMGSDDEKVYACDLDLIANELLSKAKSMVKAGLPASMEERFIKPVLDMPVQITRLEEHSFDPAAESVTTSVEIECASTGTSQNSNSTDMTAASDITTATTISSTATSTQIDGLDAAETKMQRSSILDVTYLLRLRTALNYMLTRYVRLDLRIQLHKTLSNCQDVEIDFRPLDERLATISKMKAEAQALRSIGDNMSRKRGVLDDEEAMERHETKKRKKEEEEARKRSMSLGVKKLMKADTSGMKKLSSFFIKTPAKAT